MTATQMRQREPVRQQMRILAVDDDKYNLLLLRRILERDGYTWWMS